MKAYKGFNKDMTCRGFQYKEGETYTCEEASLCNSGFHACENPIDCFGYYPPGRSEYHEVELEEVSGDISGDSKRCGKKIKVGARIEIMDMVKATFEYVKEHCTSDKQGDDYACLTGGYGSALTGGNSSALTGGNRSALTGGYGSALTGGYGSALTGGDCSALTGGNRSALTGGYGSALTGGDCSALTGGDCSVVYGGEGSKVKGGLRSVLAIQYWKGNEFIRIAFAEVDGEKIKADTWYQLDENGEFVESEDE